jgi:hypothetical protein
MLTTRSFITSAALMAALASTGCASNSELAKVQAEARDAQRLSEQAMAKAREADARSLSTEEAINRSYRHTLRK